MRRQSRPYAIAYRLLIILEERTIMLLAIPDAGYDACLGKQPKKKPLWNGFFLSDHAIDRWQRRWR